MIFRNKTTGISLWVLSAFLTVTFPEWAGWREKSCKIPRLAYLQCRDALMHKLCCLPKTSVFFLSRWWGLLFVYWPSVSCFCRFHGLHLTFPSSCHSTFGYSLFSYSPPEACLNESFRCSALQIFRQCCLYNRQRTNERRKKKNLIWQHPHIHYQSKERLFKRSLFCIYLIQNEVKTNTI